jgi:peptide/nickel transport system permease protein
VGFLSFLTRRFGTSILVLLGATFITFTISHLLPVNPLATFLGKIPPSPQLVKIYTSEYHLKDPVYVQYFYYLNGLAHLQLGYSLTAGEPVAEAIAQKLPYTLQLWMLAMLFTIVFTISSGLLSAKYGGKIPDKIVRIIYFVFWAAPSFFIALILIVVFAFLIPIFPTSKPIDITIALPRAVTGIPLLDALIDGDWPALWSLLYHAILPSLALSLGLYGIATRVLRSSILDSLNLNFVRAARSRGVSENGVIFGYAFRNAVLTLVSLLSTLSIATFGGVIFVENIFSYPGLGQFAVTATLAFDYPAILGVTLVFALIIVITNFAADLIYSLVDPRVRYS